MTCGQKRNTQDGLSPETKPLYKMQELSAFPGVMGMDQRTTDLKISC